MMVPISFCITVVNNINYESGPALHILNVSHSNAAGRNRSTPPSSTVNASVIKTMSQPEVISSLITSWSQLGQPRNTEGRHYQWCNQGLEFGGGRGKGG